MDSYKHKSGAQKRKERDQKIESSNKGLRTLFEVGVKRSDFQKSEEECGSAGDLISKNEEILSDPEVSLNIDENEICESKIEKIEASLQSSGFSDLAELSGCPNIIQIETFVTKGPFIPNEIPNDGKRAFPRVVLQSKTKNGELRPRDWLSWSSKNQSLFCFPCRLFSNQSELTEHNRSVLMSQEGWKKEFSWRKLYDKVPKHETSVHHKKCYVEWRTVEARLKKGNSIDNQLDEEILNRKRYWQEILKRILSVILFLAERGLPFRGESSRIGDPHNGNFLGIIELLAKYDPLLREYIAKVKNSQENDKRLQAHYLSGRAQNEFIDVCGKKVLDCILNEREKSKYYSILVDATPDVAHEEQLTFILRYLLENESGYKVTERFLSFVACNKKTGEGIANEIFSELAKHGIPLSDCRGQGYDNGANMTGVYKGVKTRISDTNPYALFSNCAAHSLNLCGVNAAESCEEAVTFFGILQQLYKFFSKSPQRWEILEREIKCSLHKLSDTRWSARVDAVRPFAKHLPGIRKAVAECLKLNMSADCKTELMGIEKYLRSFKCVLMATIWFKLLVSIDYRNKVLQSVDATLDLEVSYIDGLIQEVSGLREKFNVLLQEAKLVANAMQSELPLETEFPEKRVKKRKHFHDESSTVENEHGQENVHSETKEEKDFRINVFYKIIDCIILNLSERFENTRHLSNIFQCLWQYLDKDETEMAKSCQKLLNTFPEDLSEDLIQELLHLKSIHTASFGSSIVPPFILINKLKSLKLELLFPNLCIAIRLFCTLPVSVAGAERSFSALKRIKTYFRSTMGQERLCGLTTLAMEPDLARTVEFKEIIEEFANRKSRKVLL